MVSHQQLALEVEVNPTTCTWPNNNDNNINSNSSPLSHKTDKIAAAAAAAAADEESDEDLFTVPDVESSGQGHNMITDSNSNTTQNQKPRRGRNPVDKEYRRLKRLLRNRVSAQQARERKKVYVNDLELRAKQLQDTNSKLEEKISTLINENTMLRKVLLNTRPKVDESTEHKQQD